MAENDIDLPFPTFESTDEEALTGTFGSTDAEPDPRTPLGAAFLWWLAPKDSANYRDASATLSVNPSAWSGYHEVADLIRFLSILTGAKDNSDDPVINYVRFIKYAGMASGHVFVGAKMHKFFVLTVVKPEGSAWWLVWGLSDSYFSAFAEVREI